MPVMIRLKRVSDTAKKRTNFRIVVIDGTRSRDGRAIEEVGFYDPSKKPAVLKIDRERIETWVKKGAQLSDTVRSFMKKTA
jgi:small subunit ribosomal protein S16